MAHNPEDVFQYHADIVKRIFKNKEEFHRQQARLPIEEKIQILVELQKIALTLRPNRGPGDTRVVWQLKS
jgi:hypothetical protein